MATRRRRRRHTVCVFVCVCVLMCSCASVCVCVSVHLRLYLYLLPNRRRNVPSASAAEPHPDTPQAALEQMHLGQTMDRNVGLPCSCYSRHPLPLLLFHYSTYPYLPRPTRSFFCFATGEMHLDDVCCICWFPCSHHSPLHQSTSPPNVMRCLCACNCY